MTIKRKRIIIVLMVSMLFLGLLAGCASEDTATVKIILNRSDQANIITKSLWDKIVIFLFGGTSAYAGAGSSFDQTWDNLTLIIEGDGMDKIETQIPPLLTEYLLVLPAGTNRKITVIGAKQTVKKWGAQKNFNLNGGEAIEINLLMLPMANNLYEFMVDSSSVQFHWDYMAPMPSVASGSYIYQSLNSDGPYVKVKTIIGTGLSYSSTTISGLSSMTKYYFKVSYFSGDNESALSDYLISTTTMP